MNARRNTRPFADREETQVERVNEAPLLFSTALLLLVLELLVGASFAQQVRAIKPAIDWDSLKPQIEVVLSAATTCNEQRRGVEIMRVADVTGDGVPEALVEYCHMGAYTSDVALMRVRNGQPLVARFRDEHVDVIQPEFLEGASAMHGVGTELLPKEHAVYVLSWDANSSGDIDRDHCHAQAYVWNASSQTFNFDSELSKVVTEGECRRVRQEIGCGGRPCPKESN